MDLNPRLHGAAPFRVVAIHGGPGAAGEMARVARRLSRDHGVIEPLQTAQSVDGQVEELRQAIELHCQIPAVLIGYSWGAWLSLLLAARYPELCGKLILVSTPPLIETSAAQLRTSRLDRLDDAEKVEYAAAIAALADPTAPDSDHWLERLGRLGGKADAYAPVDRTDAPGDIRVSARIYRAVWKEASEMRRSGELLRRVQMVRCLVVAIHGDADSSPAAGVAGPLSDAIEQFRFTVLGRCGHTPWLERYATDSFYSTLLAEIG